MADRPVHASRTDAGYHVGGLPLLDVSWSPSDAPRALKEVSEMKIEIKKVEAIKATRIHLNPSAGGA